MPEELTTEYTMENWREATRNWTFMPYYVGEGLPGTVYVGEGLPGTVNVGVTPEPYGRSDFERNLRKVSTRRKLPVGEHVREVIDMIKGNET